MSASSETRAGTTRIVVVGLGGVGLALLELLSERKPSVSLTGVADSRGAIASMLDPADVIDLKRAGPLPAEVERSDLIKLAEPHVVVDVTSCDLGTAEPAVSVILTAFELGAHAVTANKAPLARFWSDVQAAATRAGKRIGYAAAAGAALPAVAVARSLRRTDDVTSFEGVLTGTTTFVLDQMSEGASLEAAVASAQEQGVAEPDPSVDIGGWDTASKVVILANTLWGTGYTLDDVKVTGLVDTLQQVRGDRVARLVGRARPHPKGEGLEVAPLLLHRDHPLARLRGREKGVVFYGPEIGHVLVSGGHSHPRGAAAAVLGDILELAEKR
jgi:homoserine dehydrogenase